MPPVILAVGGALAGAAVSSAVAVGSVAFSLGVSLSFATGFTISAATIGAIAGGLVSTAISIGGGLLLSPKKKRLGGDGVTNNAIGINGGLKTLVRLSDDTQKIIYGRARIGGTLAYIETYPTAPDSGGMSQTGDNLFLHMIIIHVGHECDAFEEFYLNDDLVTLNAGGFVQEAPYLVGGKSYVRIKTHLGSDTQIADSTLISEATNWTSNHRLRGLCYSYIRFQWNPDVFQGGIPTLNVLLRGKKIYDPRTTLTAWSNNAALCKRDYIYSRDFNDIPYGFGARASEIDDTFTTAAANTCDENITKLDASTIARYTINGIIDTAKAPLANLDDMLSASIATITMPMGKFRIYAGAYDTPEATVVDESWLSGNIKSTLRISRQELFNAVRGLYIEPSKKWQSDSFPEVTSTIYEAEDNGERIYTDIQLPFTTDPEAAQRIAKTVQRKMREQISVVMPCNYKAMRFAVWDTIKVNNTAHGWSEKVFRIISMTFEIMQGVVLHLREENSASYSWTASDAEAVASAPDTNLPDAFTVSVPSAVSFDSRAVQTVAGDTVYNLVLNWAAYGNSFVNNGGQFEIQFKLSSASAWRPSFYVAGDFTAADIPSITPNVTYDLRIRAVNVLGARSNWVTITGAKIGSTGGVSTTEDWGIWTGAVSTTEDWGNWTTSPSTTEDWGYYT